MTLPINSRDSLFLNHAGKPHIQIESGSEISETGAGSEMPQRGRRPVAGISLHAAI
jgi:hypothetical protein